MNNVELINGDSVIELAKMPKNSVDSIVTDPPYGISFMNKEWDKGVPGIDIWKECLRVLKPGGHLLSFAGTRTQHRMACNIEDAGFEIRDMMAWIYGSGFPKSHNIGKAIDKLEGNEREITGKNKNSRLNSDKTNTLYESGTVGKQDYNTKGTSIGEGWGTALKPALEPITVARKPLSEKTVAKNVLKWGTGGINIDECRVGDEKIQVNIDYKKDKQGEGWGNKKCITELKSQGRFPANLIHDGSEEVEEIFPVSSITGKKSIENCIKSRNENKGNSQCDVGGNIKSITEYNDKGSASRFFYCPKTSKKDRDEGLEEFEEKERICQGLAGEKNDTISKNTHPTVKPTKLMQYLVRLVTPKGGTVLDPFMGSGSTGKAAKIEGFDFIGIDLSQEYVDIAEARINNI